MNYERKARIANGLIVLVGSLLAFWDLRFLWVVVLMGASLIFSGAADYCGFVKIFTFIDSRRGGA